MLHREIVRIRRWSTRHSLFAFLMRRVVAMILLGLGTTIVAFTLIQLVPGDPAAMFLGQQGMNDPVAVQAFHERYGLDQPMFVQYFRYLDRLIHGDLGVSLQTQIPVADSLLRFIPATAELAVSSIVLSTVFGVTMGLVSALYQGRAVDQGMRLVALTGLSTPSFWLALVVLFVFFVQLSWFPGVGRLDPGATPPLGVTGWYTIDALLEGDWAVFASAVRHLVLPAAVLAVYNTALFTRITRASILEVLNQDYVRAARAKGLPERQVIIGHVLRAGLLPLVTLGGLAFANVMTGSVLIESIFSWPGLGQFAYQSAINLDRAAIIGVSLFVALVYVSLNLAVDLLYGVMDPRIRVS